MDSSVQPQVWQRDFTLSMHWKLFWIIWLCSLLQLVYSQIKLTWSCSRCPSDPARFRAGSSLSSNAKARSCCRSHRWARGAASASLRWKLGSESAFLPTFGSEARITAGSRSLANNFFSKRKSQKSPRWTDTAKRCSWRCSSLRYTGPRLASDKSSKSPDSPFGAMALLYKGFLAGTMLLDLLEPKILHFWSKLWILSYNIFTIFIKISSDLGIL